MSLSSQCLFFCSGRAWFLYFSCEGPGGAAAGHRGCDNGRRLRGPPASRSSRFPPRPQGQKTIHTRQKPDCAAELEKLVLGRKGWGRGPSEAPGPLPGSSSIRRWPWASQKVPSLGDASCQGHLSKDQRPAQGRWCCWEPLGRDRSCRRTGRGGAEGPKGRKVKAQAGQHDPPGRAPGARGRGPKRRGGQEPGEAAALSPQGLGDAREPSDSPRGAADHAPCSRERAACAARACPPRRTRSNSRAVCACLFLSLEVAHFHFLVPFGSSARSGSARARECVPTPARACVRARARSLPSRRARGNRARGGGGPRNPGVRRDTAQPPCALEEPKIGRSLPVTSPR